MNAPLADLKPLIAAVGSGRSLTAAEADRAFHIIMAGEATASQTGAFLMALAMRGETIEEIAGGARGMRSHMHRLHAPEGAMDIVGTGGDGTHTLNVSTATALVVAGCGVTVAKHGNRAVSSRCGSADVFEALGVGLEAPPDRVARALDEARIAFFFAPAWHPSMRHAGPTRRELGVRTAFNLLGPLTNPAGARRQLIGVSRPEHTELVARALGALGAERAWVVHGAGGLDELSTLGHTKVSELRNGMVNTFYVHPGELGLPVAAAAALAGGTAAENAAMLEALLAGETGPRRDVVLLNAAAALLICGAAATLQEGIARAAASLESGAARTALDRLREICPR